jgi:hypothetical protein
VAEIDLDVMRLHSYQEFQTWLAKDLEARDELYALMGDDPGIDELSLDTVETFLLGRYRSDNDALQLTERALLDAAARHIGLVLILNVDGAEWDIDLDREDDAYYRLPIIRLADRAAECPLAMATASLDRRSGEYLRGVVEHYEERYNTATDE